MPLKRRSQRFDVLTMLRIHDQRLVPKTGVELVPTAKILRLREVWLRENDKRRDPFQLREGQEPVQNGCAWRRVSKRCDGDEGVDICGNRFLATIGRPSRERRMPWLEALDQHLLVVEKPHIGDVARHGHEASPAHASQRGETRKRLVFQSYPGGVSSGRDDEATVKLAHAQERRPLMPNRVVVPE